MVGEWYLLLPQLILILILNLSGSDISPYFTMPKAKLNCGGFTPGRAMGYAMISFIGNI